LRQLSGVAGLRDQRIADIGQAPIPGRLEVEIDGLARTLHFAQQDLEQLRLVAARGVVDGDGRGSYEQLA
jgi:hypothetical protein